jgi:hypothetical protein
MLDIDFLKSLGIKEGLLLSPQPDSGPKGAKADLTEVLPVAGPLGVPPELLTLDAEELENFLIEGHSQENPYVFLMPTGIHKMAVFPGQVQEIYDLELTAEEFINFIAVSKIIGTELTGYQTRDGHWHSTSANPSPAVRASLAELERLDKLKPYE